MTRSAVTLDDKYIQHGGRVFISANQALVRLPLEQARRDRAAGLKTAGYISDTAAHRDAGEAFLCLPVLRRNTVALRTSSAGVLRRYENQFTAAPPQLVSQLPAEFEPPLIEDGFVQARLGSNLLAWSFD
jgi:hypothetical protein